MISKKIKDLMKTAFCNAFNTCIVFIRPKYLNIIWRILLIKLWSQILNLLVYFQEPFQVIEMKFFNNMKTNMIIANINQS